MRFRSLLVLLLGLWRALSLTEASAHPLSAAQVEISLSEGGRYQVEVSCKLRDLFLEDWPGERPAIPLPAGVAPRYQSFAAQYTAASSLTLDGAPQPLRLSAVQEQEAQDETGLTGPVRVLLLRYEGELPPGAVSLVWSNRLALGQYAFLLRRPGAGEPELHWLSTGEASPPLTLDRESTPGRMEVIATYLWLGYTHILPLGIDHVLFVLGLFFLGGKLRPLLLQVSAFTAAHTITLGLSIYRVVTLPPELVEPLIAASIAYVGVENMVRRELHHSRLWLVFTFGLLHGMGFAGVLQELGLPPGAQLTALLSFNVGVELGQVAVLAIAFLTVGLWARRHSWYRSHITVPASLLIALCGLYWAVERGYQSFAG